MATQVQLRGGTTSEHSTFTGAVREVTVDTDKDVLVVHDGSTAGGKPMLSTTGGTMTGDIAFGDNDKATFGAGDDLQIYHDGTDNHSRIVESHSTGQLIVAAANIVLTNTGETANYFRGVDGGEAILYHAGSTKLATTSTGVDITGTVNGLEINTTATSNIGLGSGAVDSITTGDYNVGVGDDALTATTEGYKNIAVGWRALLTNTTGESNTAIGVDSMRLNVSGVNNTAVGRSTLAANTTASYGTALGNGALAANTTGAYNVSSGYQSMYSNTTGANNTALGSLSLYNNNADNNTAIGMNALYANTTGTANVAVGYRALDANTTASNNTALGRGALYSNTTGETNTAIGKDALYANTTGTGNTGTGYRAGLAVTTGDYNTLIGYRAGYYSTDLSTGIKNVIVGAYSRPSSADSTGANGIGYDINAEAGYTTVGQSGSDIRAAHGTATWATVSDERYKKDITDSTAGLSLVNALQPRTFKYKTLGELPTTFNAYKADSTEVYKNSNTNHGFVAQEVKTAIDADSSIKDGFRLWDDREDGSQEVAEAALIPVLVKAIQELSAKNEALLTRIEVLENA